MLVEHVDHMINESPNLECQDGLTELDRVVLIFNGVFLSSAYTAATFSYLLPRSVVCYVAHPAPIPV